MSESWDVRVGTASTQPAGVSSPAAVRRLPNRLGLAGWVVAGRYPLERYLYTLHRLSGIGLVLYLPVHLWVTGRRLAGAQVWEATMATLSSPLFRVGEFLVLAAFIFHALNGIRLILGQLGMGLGRPAEPVYPYPVALRRQRPLTLALMVLTALFVAVGLWEMVAKA